MADNNVSRETGLAFLQKILRRHENDSNLEISSIEESPGCEKGDNYMSVVTRLSIAGSSESRPYNKSLILKRIPENEYCQEVYRSRELFDNEAAMYEALKVLLDGERELIANCLYADSEKIILDDLKPQGFLIADRIKGLDFDHTKIVLEALADIHAASIILEHSDADKFSQLRHEVKEMLYPDSERTGIGYFMNDLPKFIVLCLRAAAERGDENVKEIEYIDAQCGKSYDTLKELVKPKKYSVFCAGDCWTNNLLFKYEDESGRKIVTDVRLLDFQISRFGSVALDLLYFLHSSVQHELILEHLDSFLKIYHTRFRSKLSSLPKEVFDDLTFDWLETEMETHRLYGLFTSLWLAPAATMDAKHAPAGDDLASQTIERDVAIDYWKDKLSPELLKKVQDKCKYFIE